MLLTMVHANAALLNGRTLTIDRKFHVGMQKLVAGVRAPVATVHPELAAGQAVMDPVELDSNDLPYKVVTVKTDARRIPLEQDMQRLRSLITNSRLVYGAGLASMQLAREAGVRYIMVLEQDLKTQITEMTGDIVNPLRKAARSLRCAWEYASRETAEMRHAFALHCNGYPVFDAASRYNGSRLLYLDSRMSSDMLIPADALERRLATRGNRPLRLLYTGRYEALKGTTDAVRVAASALRRGIDLEMHFYGQGRLRDEMQSIAETSVRPGRIVIHDAVPYPELVRIARTFDIFICCHVQNDPSCTYLESFGAGLPIAGYANRMWRRLCAASGGGLASAPGKPELVVDSIAQLAANPDALAQMSHNALQFAREHCYEREFQKRIDGLNAALD